MIWFFLAGFISGVIGTVMLAKHISIKMDEKKAEVDKNDKCTG